jgi:glyoxylase-like metal-dependent hydrolase (beta-lactamase superfamily II)
VNSAPLEDVRPALKELGLELRDVEVILNTHGHHDHLGGNFDFKREAPTARIHLHRADRAFAESHEYHRTFMTEYLRHFGREADMAARGAAVVQLLGDGDAGVDRLLDDGDRVDLGAGVELRVIHSPGHTPGSVCYYWESEKLMLSGDSIQARGSRAGGWPLYFHAADFRRSIDRLLDVPVETLCLGHGFHSNLPLNTPVKQGAEARHMLEESAAVTRAIDEAVRAQLAANPAASNLEVAQAAAMDLIGRIPTLLDPGPKLPGAAATLWAHIREAREDLAAG